jgi:opacity protein-like surface antigen
MITKTFSSLSCLLFLCLSSALIAEAKEQAHWYIDAKIGLSHPRKTTEEFAPGKLKNDIHFDARVGYQFNANFASDISLMTGHRYAHDYTYTILDPETKEPTIWNNKANVKFLAIAANSYLKANHNKIITPYIGVGIGITRNSISNTKVTDLSHGIEGVRTGGAKYNLLWQAMLGAKMKLNDQFDMTIEYKYMDLGKFKTGTDLTYQAEGFKSTEKPSKSRLRINSLLLGLRYNL